MPYIYKTLAVALAYNLIGPVLQSVIHSVRTQSVPMCTLKGMHEVPEKKDIQVPSSFHPAVYIL